MRTTTTIGMALAVGALALAGSSSPGVAAATVGPMNTAAIALPQDFHEIQAGPDGGTVWQVRIADPSVANAPGLADVYLPPGYASTDRYPVLYLLHGTPGSPSGFVDSLRFAQIADLEITSGRSRAFIAVMPEAGLGGRFRGEWAGPWEDYVVDQVVPWTDSHLSTVPHPWGRALAGLSSGGFGAVDITLRHPDLFGVAEAWSGYFEPLRNGDLRRAGTAQLAAHNPSLLVEQEAPLLRRLGVRFFLSAGLTTDRSTADDTTHFSGELAKLGIPQELLLGPGGHDARFWVAQLPDAIHYAVPPTTNQGNAT